MVRHRFNHKVNRLLLGVENTGHVTTEHRPQTYCFDCFPRSFVLLFPIVLHQLSLLHQVGAGESDWPHSSFQ